MCEPIGIVHIEIPSSWESWLENLLEPYLDPASHSTGQPRGVSICRSEMKCPKSGQDRRDAAVFHCNVGQVLLLAWGSGGKCCQPKSNAQRRTQTSCLPKEWGQYFRKRCMGILEVGGQEGRNGASSHSSNTTQWKSTAAPGGPDTGKPHSTPREALLR